MPLPDIPPGLEALANAELDAFVAQLGAVQDIYFPVNGKMFQGLPTHIVLPSEGIGTPANTTRKPSDQVHSFDDVGITFSGNRIIGCASDVYQSPTEWGCTGRGEIKVGGKHWMRVVLVRGSETEREFDWTDVTAEEE